MRRAINESDFEELYSIYMHPSVVFFMNWEQMPREEFQPFFRKMKQASEEDPSQESGYWGWEEEGRLKATFITKRFENRRSHVVHIGRLAVSPECHGQGVAQRMMEDLMIDFSSRGISRFELEVESDNPRGIRFYEKLGFKKEGLLKHYFKRSGEDHFVDDYIMARVGEAPVQIV